MPTLAANDIEICYERWGSPTNPPLLLVMGLGAQMVVWSPEFISHLLDAGFQVIRYDNRDVGLSSKTQGTPPDTAEIFAKAMAGETAESPYGLTDMANDGMAVLDHLGIDAAHVVGASMGGMIAQHMAFEQPQRVLSLTSIMSTTGNRDVGGSAPEAAAALLTPPPLERDAAIENGIKVSKAISGPLWQEQDARERAVEQYDRCFHPAGTAFQFAAIQASGDRTEQLKTITAPTLVVHGAKDALLNVSGGEATAAAIPGAELLVLEDMGHDMPSDYLAEITAAIVKVAGI